MRAVARRLGAEYLSLGEPDEALFDTWETRLKMIQAIRSARAELIFTHFTVDYNLDHSTTSQIVYQAAMLSTIASIGTESAPLAKVPPIFYVDPGPGHGFDATHFVAIAPDVVDEAIALMGLHESQMAVSRRLLGKDYRDDIRERMKATGARIGAEYAEAFRPCLAPRRTPAANLLP
jgi:LmbE family N-acetylglucosaminyl deacetylase